VSYGKRDTVKRVDQFFSQHVGVYSVCSDELDESACLVVYELKQGKSLFCRINLTQVILN